MERHVQTVLGAIIIALILWVGNTLTTNQTQMAIMHTNLTVLTDEVSKLRAKVEQGVDDRYRASDARRDFADVWEAIKDMQEDHYRIVPPQP